MDLIYADIIEGLIIDRGVLTNYTFDLSYGADENDFLLTLPLSGVRLSEDQIVYIPGTEYGGIIDSIKVDTSTQMLMYSGRSWHGILESKILYPEPGKDYMYVSGEANSVLATLLERMNIIPGDYNELYVQPTHPIITVSQEDSGIFVDAKITSESGNYAHGYSFIRDLLYASSAKPKIIDGVLSAEPLMDYSSSADFLEGTDQFTAKHNYNAINRLHCLGAGELRDRYTIDLYLSEGGTLLPYSKENPIQDSDYYTDINALAESTDPEDVANFTEITQNMVTGAKEISDIYDYPNAQVTYHYVEQTEQPADWGSDLTPNITDIKSTDKLWGFQQYFYQDPDNDGKYKSLEKPSLDYDYQLQYVMPADWLSNFANYYTSGAKGYEKVTSVTAYDVQSTEPSGWYEGTFMNYYKYANGSYTKLSLVPGYVILTDPPGDWETSYGNYYNLDETKVQGVKSRPAPVRLTSASAPSNWNTNYGDYYIWDGTQYKKVAGESVTKYRKLASKPSDWNSSYKNYYRKVGKEWVACTSKKQWDIKKVRQRYTVQKAPEYKKNVYFSWPPEETNAPTFVSGQYKSSGRVVPAFNAQTVYKKRTVPTWTTNKYYTAVQYQPIPEWGQGIFTQYEDHYQALIEGALKKIEDSSIQDELEIKLDELTTYDINDRVGASDEVTGIGAVERITQKIVKIKRGIVSFDYNTGK